MTDQRGQHVPLSDALAAQPVPGELAAALAKRDDVDIEFYSPHLMDLQQPHERNELYVIARGTGVLLIDNDQFPFKTGDVLFVPAFAEHRFLQFSTDFATWVMFIGPAVARS